MTAPLLPFTEQTNPLTAGLDAPDAMERLRLLLASDREILAGIPGQTSLRSPEFVAQCVRVAAAARIVLSRPRGAIVLAGAGTSGRLAVLLARLYNERLAAVGRRPALTGLIAGGAAAFATPVEGAEDDLEQAAREAAGLLTGGVPNVFVGITCGLSAPYVAGGLGAAMAHPTTHVALLGFNPIAMARPAFRPVAEQVVACKRGTVLAPVIGPEPLAGSTRMKGGTATLLILGSILDDAMAPDEPDRVARMARRLRRLEAVLERFSDTAFLGGVAWLCGVAGEALVARRSVVYAGRGMAGALGVIDASECVPTFGAEPDQMLAFIDGGLGAILPGAPRSGNAPPVRIDRRDFEALRPTLAAGCVVIQIGDGKAIEARVVGESLQHRLDLGETDDDVVRLLRLKLVLNAISTCAFVSAGKVFGNQMIDLRLSNSKLYRRAIRIVADLTGIAEPAAELAVLGAIHGIDHPSREMVSAPVATQVAAAARRSAVVPTAILMAGASLTFASARAALEEQPVIRLALRRAVTP